jgi:predicted PilT family ATPase
LITLEFQVPTEAAGMIVGKKGAHIRRFKQECNVRVLLKKDDEGEESETKAVFLEGSGSGLDKAILMLCETLAQWAENTKQEPQRKLVDFWMKELKAQPQKPPQQPPRKPAAQQTPGTSGRGGKAAHAEDPNRPGVAIKYWVPSDAVRWVVGKQGKTIGQLKKETGCAISLGPDAPNNKPGSTLLVIQGGEEECAEARRRIIDCLAKSKMEMATGVLSPEDPMVAYRARTQWIDQHIEKISVTPVEAAQPKPEKSATSPADRPARQNVQNAHTLSVAPGKVEIHITKAAAAMIIGKKGAMHKHLQIKTGAVISVEQDALADGRKRLTIEGSEQSINTARKMVEEILRQCDDSKYEEVERKKQAEEEEKRRAEEAVRRQRKEEQARRQAQVKCGYGLMASFGDFDITLELTGIRHCVTYAFLAVGVLDIRDMR